MKEVPAGGGNTTTVTSGLTKPDGLAFDPAGDLFVAEYGGIGTVSMFSKPVSVPFTLGGPAASGVDYSGVTASPLTFGVGQTTLDITGSLLPVPGPNQTMTFTLSRPTTPGASLGSPSVNTLTIIEPPIVQFSAGSETINEAAGTFSIPVTLSGAVNDTVTLPFTLGGTAVSGTDFSGVIASPLRIGPGQTTADITGTLLSDPGPIQTMTLTLGTPMAVLAPPWVVPRSTPCTSPSPRRCGSAPAARP